MNIHFSILTEQSIYWSEIAYLCFNEWKEEFIEFENVSNPKDCECYFRNILRSNNTSFIMVAESNNQLIGFIMLCETDFPLRPQYKPWVCNFYIKDQYRHNGIGRSLFTHFIEKANNTDTRIKYIWTHHLHLKSFYESFGFRHIETLIHQAKPAYILCLFI
jgi:predicted N-acetyltransferase YhbS